MDKLTDFSDLSDVSDAAIEWVTSHGACSYERPSVVRDYSGEGYSEDRAIIIAARLIQQHRPDLLVDPVDAVVWRIVDAMNWSHSREGVFNTAKQAYQMGLEAGKKS